VNLAHDLRTPLTLIQSPLYQLKERTVGSKNISEMVDLTMNNVNKLSNLFNQLMDFDKADKHKMNLQIAKHNISEHLNNVVSSFTSLIENKQIKCELQINTDEAEFWYDKLIMDKILLNLITNAIKYTPKGGFISISLTHCNNTCVLEVVDNGIGIPEHQQRYVFNRYFRASNAINSCETGSGVGLLLVKNLVSLHHGEISFKSIPNQGTSFKVSFPSNKEAYKYDEIKKDGELYNHISDFNLVKYDINIEPKKEMTELIIEGANQQVSPTVLVVDDNKELQLFLYSSLKEHYKVLLASNGREALDIVENSVPDIIVSDIMMPEMDGNMLCKRIKSNIETSHIPVILLTALSGNDNKIGSYEFGADDYIVKPFDVQLLVVRIENLIKSRNLLKEKFLKENDIDSKAGFQTAKDNEFLRKAVKIVKDNISDPDFSVVKFCGLIEMSRPVLFRKLKSLVDQSPRDFIKIIRLKTAARLMLETDLSVKEITFKTGFADPKYFSSSFKKIFGVSPREYRNQNVEV
jgi:CheY-like chemotaxis protein/two-component sensor histidine kinase